MEQLLHYTWKHKLYGLHALKTTEGKTVEIIDPGLANIHAGPDFFNAKIKIDDVLWVGNVEIHEHSSDWFRHGHHTDCDYDSVILHVASDIDATVQRSNGEVIPQMELHYPEQLLKNYEELLHEDRYPACFRIIPQLSKFTVHSWMTALQIERFENKAKSIEKRLADSNQDWEQAFFITLARNFGFGVNSDAFELWAKNVPLSAVNKHRDDLFQIEAFFFGQAGLLNELPNDEYTERMIKEYEYMKHKFELKPSEDFKWKFLRLRPGNFPHVRIAQLANLYHRSQGMLSKLMETKTLKELRNLLRGGTSEYWLTHYVFGEPSTSLCLRAESLLEELKPENNHIIRLWKECGLEAAHAADSQALIQLKKEYCDLKKCLFCRIGYEYLKCKPQQ